jgi:putative intracellular protease/amidase
MVPDMILDDLDPADSNLLILPDADMWDAGGGTAFAAAAARYLDAGVPVAAICGATAGLVRALSWTTAPQSPVQFACATLRRLGLASHRKLEYEEVFRRADTTAYPALMDAQDAA